MTDSKHTPGPWSNAGYGLIVGEDDVEVGITPGWREKNRRHVIACVNGCEGLNPEAYREVVEALEWYVEADGHSDEITACAHAALAKARGEG